MRIAALTAQLDNSSYDRDTLRLGQLVYLYLESSQLAAHRRGLSHMEYNQLQQNYYLLGLQVLGEAKEDD